MYFQDRKLLFLGKTDRFQAWARLRLYPRKPDEVDYLRFSFLSDTSKVERNPSSLPINMYPFKIVADKGCVSSKEKLTALVRYVFREAAGVNQPFTMDGKTGLQKSRLRYSGSH